MQTSPLRRAALATMLSAPALLGLAPAAACEITRTPWGLRAIDCNLSDFFPRQLEGAIALDPAPYGIRLRLPNLAVTDLDNRLRTELELDVEAEVTNLGEAVAPSSQLAAVATVHDPLNKGAEVARYSLGPVAVSSLAVGAGVSRYIGTIAVPNRSQDWDVCSIATADPPVTGGAAYGKVIERDETDNLRTDCCRVFGPNPGGGPPSC
jgi:hypothetical protein